jgi:hypothetical protein
MAFSCSSVFVVSDFVSMFFTNIVFQNRCFDLMLARLEGKPPYYLTIFIIEIFYSFIYFVKGPFVSGRLMSLTLLLDLSRPHLSLPDLLSQELSRTDVLYVYRTKTV